MQQEIELSKLYKLSSVNKIVRNSNLGVDPIIGDGLGQGKPRISVYNGVVNLYGADAISAQPTSIANMILDDSNITGIRIFETIPDYLYLSGTSTKVVVSGAIYNEIGAFE